MDSGRFLFILEIPPKFERDVLAHRRPTMQINVDATAMTQAGNGSVYLQNIVTQEAQRYAGRAGGATVLPLNLEYRSQYNPNLRTEWFNAMMSVVSNFTLLAIVLTGAALLREREHRTVEHLLVMPVRPAEIVIAKIWANGLVIVAAATASMVLVVHKLIGVPLAGSVLLFIAGTILYQVSVGALGILLAFTGTMGQFGLLVIPVIIVLDLLSGAATPLESIPQWLQDVMQFTPSTHYVAFVQLVLSRGAGIDIVWPELAALAAFGIVFFSVSLARFRTAIASFQ
jgi:ABC-2 type transport system permease protein